MNIPRAPRKLMLPVISAVLLTVVLGTLAFAITHIKPNAPIWQHKLGQTLTEVKILPTNLWGFGSGTMNLMTATGATVNGGSNVKCGFFEMSHYNLRVWSYDPKTGILAYGYF